MERGGQQVRARWPQRLVQSSPGSSGVGRRAPSSCAPAPCGSSGAKLAEPIESQAKAYSIFIREYLVVVCFQAREREKEGERETKFNDLGRVQALAEIPKSQRVLGLTPCAGDAHPPVCRLTWEGAKAIEPAS